MKVSPEFKKRLNRELRLLFREMRDGCCDCRDAKGFCHKHLREAMAIAADPKKHLNLESVR